MRRTITSAAACLLLFALLLPASARSAAAPEATQPALPAYPSLGFPFVTDGEDALSFYLNNYDGTIPFQLQFCPDGTSDWAPWPDQIIADPPELRLPGPSLGGGTYLFRLVFDDGTVSPALSVTMPPLQTPAPSDGGDDLGGDPDGSDRDPQPTPPAPVPAGDIPASPASAPERLLAFLRARSWLPPFYSTESDRSDPAPAQSHTNETQPAPSPTSPAASTTAASARALIPPILALAAIALISFSLTYFLWFRAR